MKIRDQDGLSKSRPQKAETAQPPQTQRSDATASIAPSREDRVELSARARALQAASAALAQQPAIRSDKVERLKKRIAEGKYQVSGDSIAEKLLDES
ncbi:MAG TPA: flagellar biosynthesis anti-sigma factor FlgM [Candidatus Baltobacteraceae bacterium]|nr:flagellar biosynthesis anti-sigma factor FlgM [Candidatus Baltobacteraceae bacterium]